MYGSYSVIVDFPFLSMFFGRSPLSYSTSLTYVNPLRSLLTQSLRGSDVRTVRLAHTVSSVLIYVQTPVLLLKQRGGRFKLHCRSICPLLRVIQQLLYPRSGLSQGP